VSVEAETELKLQLPRREDYFKLLDAQPEGSLRSVTRHEDYYFDTPDRQLLGCGAVLRLRHAQIVTLTFKQGKESRHVAGYFESTEVAEELPLEALRTALHRPEALLHVGREPARELMRRWGKLELQVLGRLRVKRRRYEREYPLEVDHVTLPHHSEAFELEIETADPRGAHAWIRSLLDGLQIEARPQRKIKLELLLECLERKSGGR
jgi:uncharacterized protein YjbK